MTLMTSISHNSSWYLCHTCYHSLCIIYLLMMMQAHDILATAKHDSQLHHAACNFTKVPGTIYHLYERSNGTPYFSMLSPSEWGGACPHKFLGSYRLEHDHSWTPYEKIEARDRDIKAIDRAILARPSRRTWTNKSSIYNFIIISCQNSIIYALWCIWWEIKIPSLSGKWLNL